jgi:hypothetical protein
VTKVIEEFNRFAAAAKAAKKPLAITIRLTTKRNHIRSRPRCAARRRWRFLFWTRIVVDVHRQRGALEKHQHQNHDPNP